MVVNTKINSQNERKEIRRKTGIRNFVFNRYMMLRYVMSLFFITNIYWTFLLANGGLEVFAPATLLVVGAFAMFEHIRLYGRLDTTITYELRFNQYFFKLQVVVNVLMIGVSLLNIGHSRFFPFLADARDARLFMSAILALGIGLSCLCLVQITRIKKGTDKHLKLILKMKQSSQF